MFALQVVLLVNSDGIAQLLPKNVYLFISQDKLRMFLTDTVCFKIKKKLREIVINIWRVEIKKDGCGVSIQACYSIPEQSRNYIHFSH